MVIKSLAFVMNIPMHHNIKHTSLIFLFNNHLLLNILAHTLFFLLVMEKNILYI